MAYSVNRIIPLNLILTPGGIDAANFVSCFFFSPLTDLDGSATLAADDYKDYTELSAVAEDWGTSTPVYHAATRWFSQTPRPFNFTVWVWDQTADPDPVTVANKAAASPEFRFFYFFPHATTNTDADVINLADFAEANEVFFSFTRTDVDLKDGNATGTIADDLLSAGYRFTFMGYREQATVDDNANQAYAHVQTLAAFQKFNPDGENTAITAEYQVLSGVVGESLSSSEYQALIDRNVVFWTQVELKGQTDASRTINTKTFSSYDEFIDDVFNLEVLRNRVQVAAYNRISSRRRALDEKGYANIIGAVIETLKQFYNNGVLGRITYTDPRDGEERLAEYGYVLFSDPSDVLALTTSERTDREYPAIDGRVFLARAGHTAAINLTVE